MLTYPKSTLGVGLMTATKETGLDYGVLQRERRSLNRAYSLSGVYMQHKARNLYATQHATDVRQYTQLT